MGCQSSSMDIPTFKNYDGSQENAGRYKVMGVQDASDATALGSDGQDAKKCGKTTESGAAEKQSQNVYDSDQSDQDPITGACIQEVVTRFAHSKFDKDYAERKDVRIIDPMTTCYRDQTGDLTK